MPEPAVVLLPGFMCDARLFAEQHAGLTAAGFRVYHGDLTRASSVLDLARQVLVGVPPRFALAGLSMGGIVAFEILRQAAERVTHLALMNTKPRADAAGYARLAQLGRVANGELAHVLREDLKPHYLAPANRSPGNLALLDDMGRTLGEDVFVRQTAALMNRPSSEALLAGITCPALVLCGEDDRVCPPALHEDMARAIPGARLVKLAECGHISPLEQPGAVTQALLDLFAQPPAGRATGRQTHDSAAH